MSLRSGRPGSASQPEVDRRVCVELGAELLRVREARGLSLTDVGRDLLLSKRQVQALEQVDFSAFYSISFFLGALRKYVKLCGLDPARVDAAALLTPAAESTLESRTPVPEPAALSSRRFSALPEALSAPAVPSAHLLTEPDAAPQPSGRLALVALAALVGVGAVAGGYVLWPQIRPEPTAVAALTPPEAPPAVVAPPSVTTIDPPPAALVQTTGGDTGALPVATSVGGELLTPAAAPADAAPAAAPTSSAEAVTSTLVRRPSSSGYGALRSSQATWIFLRRSDSSVTERVVEAGETIPLDDRPVYLALGSPEAVLTIGGQPVDTSRFVRNGQLRMNAGDFSAVESAVTVSQPVSGTAAR